MDVFKSRSTRGQIAVNVLPPELRDFQSDFYIRFSNLLTESFKQYTWKTISFFQTIEFIVYRWAIAIIESKITPAINLYIPNQSCDQNIIIIITNANRTISDMRAYDNSQESE